jgi:SAM-dependent methyltransferase
VLDIGSGTGRDAAAFAATGHRVVAVEPVAEMRSRAVALHPAPNIEWLDDSLPDLTLLIARRQRFALVMLTAVWMHLDEQQRAAAMPKIAMLLQPGAVAIMTLRHGPVPPGRRMFPVSADETIELARKAGLRLVLNEHGEGAIERPDISWTRLVFKKPEAG